MTLLALLAGVIGGAAVPVSFDGSLSASGAGATITGTTRTATVPVGNSGVLRFDNVSELAGNLQYSKNGGAFTDIAEDGTVTLANSDTLQIQGVAMVVAGTSSFNMTDVTRNLVVQVVVIDRTS